MKKADIQRLTRMLKELDESENSLQKRYGDRTAGSIRSKHVRDADALRRVLAEITNK